MIGGVNRKLVAFVPHEAGAPGREERVLELRLETVFPAELHDQVIDALRRAHPYEEPAFDVYELL